MPTSRVGILDSRPRTIEVRTDGGAVARDRVIDAAACLHRATDEIASDLISAVTPGDRRDAGEILRRAALDPHADLGDDFTE